MADNEKLRSFEEKAKRASKLFREIRSGKFRRDGYRNPRIRWMTLNSYIADSEKQKS